VRTGLTVEDVGGLLDEPRVAVLATLRGDGSVLLSPVWHRWRNGGFDLWIGADDVKIRHLRRDPRVTIVVAESEPPLRGVEVRGKARLVVDEVFESAVAIASRYLGEEEGRAYVEAGGGDDVIVRLEPGDLRVWDFADEYG
jgi:PPOX class probable F420-dependent enzyme